MKAFGPLILAISLGLNVVLGAILANSWLTRRSEANRAAVSASATNPEPGSPSAATIRNSPSAGGKATFRDPALATDARRVMERMLADGYPRIAISGAVAGTIFGRNDAEYYRMQALQRAKWLPGSDAAAARFKELDRLAGAELTETVWTFNADAAKERLAKIDKLQYGELGPEKIALLKSIEDRANGVAEGSSRMMRTGGNGSTMTNFPDHEAKIREQLTSAEADDYLRYNTVVVGSPAQVMQDFLRRTEVSQDQYIALVDRANAMARETPGLNLRTSMTDTFAEVLGPAEVLKLIPSVNLQIAAADSYLASLDVPPLARFAIYKELLALLAARPTATTETMAEMKRDARERIIRLGNITPEQYDAGARLNTALR